MKLIDLTTSVIVTDKIQSVIIGEDKKTFRVVMDCGGVNNYVYDTEEECKQNYNALVKLLREHLEGGDRK